MIAKGRQTVAIKAVVMRMRRRTGTALIVALILALHGVVFCADSVRECAGSAAGAQHQEQRCPNQQNHDSRQTPPCVCCDSPLCMPRAELTRPNSRSASDRIAPFAPLYIATLPFSRADMGGSLPRTAAGPPSHSPVSLFLTQKTLLI